MVIRTVAASLSPAGDPGSSLVLRTLRRGGGRIHAGREPTLDFWRRGRQGPGLGGQGHISPPHGFTRGPARLKDNGGEMVLERAIPSSGGQKGCNSSVMLPKAPC